MGSAAPTDLQNPFAGGVVRSSDRIAPEWMDPSIDFQLDGSSLRGW